MLLHKQRKCRLLAAQRGHCSAVVRLLQARADASARAPGTGETALGLAAQAGKLPSLEALVAAGADLVRAVSVAAACRLRAAQYTAATSLAVTACCVCAALIMRCFPGRGMIEGCLAHSKMMATI